MSGPLRYSPISRLSRATISAGVPAGATTANQPFITTPGTVSLQRRQIRQAGKALARGDGDAAHLAGLHDRIGGGDRTDHHLVDAAGDVLGHLRGGAIRHFDQSEIGALVEQLGARTPPRPPCCRTRSRACRDWPWHRRRIADAWYRQLGVHRQHLRPEAADHRDGVKSRVGS